MKRSLHIILAFLILLASFSGCRKDQWPAEPDWDRIPDPTKPIEDDYLKPAPCSNKVIAHRGGAAECGAPDNSVAALKYSMGIKAYASECDVYWTSDNDVIVAHADADYHVNGLNPYEHTVAEIRAAGKLSNGEEIPTLKEYISLVMVPGNCTKLLLDIKKLDSAHLDYVAKCAKRTCEIVDEMKAKYFIDLLCTGTNENIMKIAWGYAHELGVEIGMNSSKSPGQYNSLGFNWANMSAASNLFPEAGGTGSVDPKAYVDAGVNISVYSLDKQRYNGDSVYSEAALKYYVSNIGLFKVITSNYPAWLISVLEKETRTYDGINNMEEYKAFVEDLRTDATAKRFQNAEGEVVLKTDLKIDDFTPLSTFKGKFNGNGKTLTINYSGTATKVGLFQVLAGTVKNLNLAGSITVTGGEGEAHIGAFAAEAEGATIQDCTSKVSVSVSEASSAKSRCFVLGGLVGKVSKGCIINSCIAEGDVSFTSPGYCLGGGLVGGSAADESVVSITRSEVKSKLVFEGTNTSDWNYFGGLTGKMQSTLLTGSKAGLVLSGDTFSGSLTIGGTSKVRGGGIAAYAKVCNVISECECSGSISIGASAQERNVGGISGFQETSCQATIKDCTFSGSIQCATGATKAYWIGGMISTGYAASSIVENCFTTSKSSVANNSLGSVGMVAARPNTAVTIKGCRIAGSINKGGEVITLTSSNIEDWMFKGSATEDSRGVKIENCGFNDK